MKSFAFWLKAVPARLRRITNGGTYRPEIDGLRFWALAPVLLFHLFQRVERGAHGQHGVWIKHLVPNGEAGVMLFFVISGFIIASQLIKRGPGLSYRSYIARRLSRIEPPYFILLTLTYIVVLVWAFHPQGARVNMSAVNIHQSFIASLIYSHGWIFNSRPELFGPGWSLEIEAEFYIAAPALVWSYAKLYGRIGPVTGAVILLMSICIYYAAEKFLGLNSWTRYTLVRYFYLFWLGVVLADVNKNQRWPKLSERTWDLFGFAGLIGQLVISLAELDFSDRLILNILRIVCFAAMMGGAINGEKFRALNSLSWISLIGGACYSIYLTHLQLMMVMTPVLLKSLPFHDANAAYAIAILAEIPVTLVVGLGVYALVERPFMVKGWPGKVWRRIFSRRMKSTEETILRQPD